MLYATCSCFSNLQLGDMHCVPSLSYHPHADNIHTDTNVRSCRQVASLTYQKCAWISAITAAAVGVITACCMPFLKKMIDNQADQAAAITAGGVMLSAEEAKEAGVKTTALHTGARSSFDRVRVEYLPPSKSSVNLSTNVSVSTYRKCFSNNIVFSVYFSV